MNSLISFENFLSESKELSDGWKISKGELVKSYKFDKYDQALKFVNRIAEIAEKQNHHPIIILSYSEVIVKMFDHEEGKISDKCHKFVEEVNKLSV